MAIELADRISKVSYAIRDIVARARKVEATGKKIHWFNIGDPNQFGFKPPACITDAIKQALNEPKYTGYCPSEGDPELRKVLAKREGIAQDRIFITSGLSEGIDFLFQSLMNPGENIMLPSPGYPLYNTKHRVMQGVGNFYQTDENFIPLPDDIRKKMNPKTRALVIINPNNPTGATYSRSVLQEIVDIAGEHSVPIIGDEIYDLMTLDGQESINLRTLTKELPLISGNGISKNFLYPGARVGYLALHGDGMAPLADAIVKLSNQRLSVNWEMQRGALAAYSNPPTHLESTRSELRKRRDIIHKRLNEIEGISCAKPTASFYAFPKIESEMFKSDNDFVFSLLEETGVLVVPGNAFSSVLPGNYFRLVFLATPEELEESMDKVEGFMKKRSSN